MNPTATQQTDHARPKVGRALFRAATWREFAFHVALVPVAAAGLAWFLTVSIGGLIAAATVVGLPIATRLLHGTRRVTDVTRLLSSCLLHQDVTPPPTPLTRPSPGVVLQDAAVWRGYGYLIVGAVVALANATVTAVILVVGLAALTMPLWGQKGFTLEILIAVGGVGVLALWPVLNHALARGHSAVIAGMLGTTRTEQRLMAAITARDTTLRGSDTTLRRIERELHDGAQARLVTVAMLLGDVLDRVRHGEDALLLEPQLTAALATTTETLGELRALVRGIHPPVLDAGLEPALMSAVARMPLHVSLRVDLPERPSPTTESTVYFGVLELLTNVQKHAHATRASVSVVADAGSVVAEVQDDGRGGAVVYASAGQDGGSGLAGLCDRLDATDGALTVASPRGGPTVIRITIPWAGTP